MIKIRKIKCIDKTQWKRGCCEKDFLVCENLKFAKVVAVMVSKLKKWDHDEIIFIEPSRNVFVVPVSKSKNIYLHQEYRPKVMKKNKVINPYSFDESKIKFLGRWSWEVPRGCFDSGKDKNSKRAAIREVEEETEMRLEPKDLVEIGKLNFNTAYAASTMPVYIAKCKNENRNLRLKAEEKEKIKPGDWFSIDDIKKMIRKRKVFCGVTLAALNLALQELEKNPDLDGFIKKLKKA